MEPVKIYSIEPLYKKSNGLYVQEIDRTDLPLEFEPLVRHLVTVPAGEISANHKHPRKEAFIGIGDDLEFIWLDNDGQKRHEKMNHNGELKLFVVDSFTPHAIKNSSTAPAVLLEYADREQVDQDIELVSLV